MDALATESGKLLLTQGVLGLCVLILGIVVVILFRELSACRASQVSDQRAAKDELIKMAATSTAAVNALTSMIAERTPAVQANAASNLEMAMAVKSLTATNEIQVSRVHDKLDSVLKAVERRP